MGPAKLREHTLNRLGHGVGPSPSHRYDELGFDGFIADQLGDVEFESRYQFASLGGKFSAAVVSHRVLGVNLLDFWFNHFNVDANNLVVLRNLHDFQNGVIRPNILGNFATMLAATAESVAMLDYLDNRLNSKEEIVGDDEFGLNENYARELLELHTLGVDGGYTQADIVDVARILTGWTIYQPSTHVFEFEFNTARHDYGAKTVLGVDFPSGRGKEEGVELLAMLAAQISTAGFISYKLCQRFINEAPPQSIVDAATATFVQTDGDLREVMRTILTSAEFVDEDNFRAKVKPPLRFAASAVLALGATNVGSYHSVRPEILESIVLMGEDPYHVAPPTGYPESSGYWMSGASMLERFRIAGTIAASAVLRSNLMDRSGADGIDAGSTVDLVAAVICPGGISASTRTAAVAGADAVAPGDDRVTAAAHMILSSPEFVRF